MTVTFSLNNKIPFANQDLHHTHSEFGQFFHQPAVVDIRHNLVIDGRTDNGLQTGWDAPPRRPGNLLRCIWTEEGQVTERPSESHIREAAAVNGVEALVVAFSKDVTIYRDAVKTTGYENKLQVKDLIKLVHERCKYPIKNPVHFI